MAHGTADLQGQVSPKILRTFNLLSLTSRIMTKVAETSGTLRFSMKLLLVTFMSGLSNYLRAT
jgi:hypothetical protein